MSPVDLPQIRSACVASPCSQHRKPLPEPEDVEAGDCTRPYEHAGTEEALDCVVTPDAQVAPGQGRRPGVEPEPRVAAPQLPRSRVALRPLNQRQVLPKLAEFLLDGR